MLEVLDQLEVPKEAQIFIYSFGCAIQSTGVKWARSRIMYTNDESDLGSAENNPPSMGGRHALIQITIT
jgi:hypothetical protein